MQVWWRSGHFSARRSDLCKSLQTDRRRTPRHCISSFLEWAKKNRNAVPVFKKEPKRRSGAFRSHPIPDCMWFSLLLRRNKQPRRECSLSARETVLRRRIFTRKVSIEVHFAIWWSLSRCVTVPVRLSYSDNDSCHQFSQDVLRIASMVRRRYIWRSLLDCPGVAIRLITSVTRSWWYSFAACQAQVEGACTTCCVGYTTQQAIHTVGQVVWLILLEMTESVNTMYRMSVALITRQSWLFRATCMNLIYHWSSAASWHLASSVAMTLTSIARLDSTRLYRLRPYWPSRDPRSSESRDLVTWPMSE